MKVQTSNKQQYNEKQANLPDWKSVMASAFREPRELLDYLGLSLTENAGRILQQPDFSLLVPRTYADKMRREDWQDPLLSQVLPLTEEGNLVSGFSLDPVGDQIAMLAPGLLKKYAGRALLITTGACAVHCRYCFRRHYPYGESAIERSHWKHLVNQLAADSSINEVILSGGDPLMLSDSRLMSICHDLASLQHIRTLRFHTRVPLILPQRLDTDFIRALQDVPVRKVMVIHANHANEIDTYTRSRLIELADSGVDLLNQAVLLKGVNDDVESLVELSQQLFKARVLPYYLHQLDKVQGASHFEVSDGKAIRLITAVRYRLPGYLVPRLVRELSGERSKQPIV